MALRIAVSPQCSGILTAGAGRGFFAAGWAAAAFCAGTGGFVFGVRPFGAGPPNGSDSSSPASAFLAAFAGGDGALPKGSSRSLADWAFSAGAGRDPGVPGAPAFAAAIHADTAMSPRAINNILRNMALSSEVTCAAARSVPDRRLKTRHDANFPYYDPAIDGGKRSMHPLSRLRALIRDEQMHVALAAGGQHHAFAQTELHLPRR